MQPPRGTRDFGPAEMARRRRVEDRFRRVLHTFNFREVQTPTFEELDLFEKKAGEGIREEIYHFKDKGGRDLCLRPELTLPVMRFYFGSELKAEPKPLKLFYFGPCYRYDRPQEGRYREFWQLGTEVVGDASPEAHAELLHLALTLFDTAGLANIQLRVGHLGVLRGFLEAHCGIPRAEQAPAMRLIDKKDRAGLARLFQERNLAPDRLEDLFALFDATTLDAIRRAGLPPQSTAGLDHLAAVLTRLADFGADAAKVRPDATIARGLEYYTGLVFELDCPDLGAEKQLLGGGEYDLSGVFGAPPVPTAGFGLGFDRTLVALERGGGLPEVRERVDALVAALSDHGVAAAQRIAGALRELDLRVELDLSARGPKRALQRGSTLRARVAVLIGDREMERGAVAVKNLDTGEQVEVPAPEVPSRLRPWLEAA